MAKRNNTDSKKNFSAVAVADLLQLLDQEKCAAWLFGQMRPGKSGTSCPDCGEALSAPMLANFRNYKPCVCSHCRAHFRAWTNTAFFHVRMTPIQIIAFAVLMNLGAKTAAIAEAVGVGQDTVNIWRAKLGNLTLADVAAKDITVDADNEVDAGKGVDKPC